MSNLKLTEQPSDADAMVLCVQAAAAASDRLNYVEPEPFLRRNGVFKATRLSPVMLDTSNFTPHECALFRALSLKFDPAKCVEMVIRARKAEGS